MILAGMPLEAYSQEEDGTVTTVDELVKMGYENVRFAETEGERIYTIENNVYKLRGIGIRKAIELIQANGLSSDKTNKLIVTHYNVPQIALTYRPTESDSLQANLMDWDISYDLGDSWKEVRKEKKKNSSLFKVDIWVYPQLSFMNLVITQIYQVLFDLNPTVEVSLWPGGKLTGQLKVPVYNDGYGDLEDKVHPGFLTLSQRVRLPLNITGKATFGYFNNDRWGLDFQAFYPFKDERFSLEGRLGYVGVGYWNGFHLTYDNRMTTTWSVGGNFYWPKFNTQFTLKGERYLLGEKGVKFEMIRHFRYTSIGFYAMKAKGIDANGGFRFSVTLPAYRMKRKGYLPRVNFSPNMGIVYNAGNEQYYYKENRAEASDNIVDKNGFNPFFIKSEFINY
jgi:opacity protein-like surface antigen